MRKSLAVQILFLLIVFDYWYSIGHITIPPQHKATQTRILCIACSPHRTSPSHYFYSYIPLVEQPPCKDVESKSFSSESAAWQWLFGLSRFLEKKKRGNIATHVTYWRITFILQCNLKFSCMCVLFYLLACRIKLIKS